MSTARYFLICTLLLANSLYGTPSIQNKDGTEGFPFHYSFSGRDYDASPQNWSFLQDDDGTIYIANSEGVLIYDGANWKLIPVDNNRPLRSIKKGSDGIIYVFGDGEAGYLVADSLGAYAYQSLMEYIPEDLDVYTIWDATVTEEGVFFRTYDYLFRWNKNTLKVWPSGESGRFGRLYSFQDKVVLYHSEDGFLTIADDELIVVSGNAPSSNSLVFFIPIDDNKALAGFQYSGFYMLTFRNDGTDIQAESFPTDLSSFIDKIILYGGMLTTHKKIAINTINAGVFLLNPDGTLYEQITERDGLRTNMVIGLGEDFEGGLWALTNNGLTRFDLARHMRYWNSDGGLSGSIQHIMRHNETLYVSTSQGFFYLEEAVFQDTPVDAASMEALLPRDTFKRVPGSDMLQTWMFMPSERVTGSKDDGFFVVSQNEYLYYVNNGEKRIVPGTTRQAAVYSLYASKRHPHTFFAGSDRGVYRITVNPEIFSNGEFEAAFTVSFVPIHQVHIRYMMEDHLGYLWIGSRFDKIIRVDTREDPHVENPGIQVLHFEDYSIVSERDNYIAPLCDGTMGIATGNGLFVLDESYEKYHQEETLPEEIFTLETRVNTLVDTDYHHIDNFVDVSADCDELWIDGNGLSRLYKDPTDGEWVFETNVIQQNMMLRVYHMYAENDGKIWIGGDEFLFLLDQSKPEKHHVPFQTMIRRVYNHNDRLLFANSSMASRWLQRVDGPSIELPYKENNVRFRYSATSFVNPEHIQYQVWLEGFERTWSSWSTMDTREYTNLPAGEYVFRVRARNGYHIVGEEDALFITILTPWYRTAYAWVVYIIGFGLFLTLLLKYRTAYLQNANKKLEGMVAERTSELEEEKMKLEKANNLLSRFMSMAAHDLRNPAGVIIGYADLLETDKDEPDKVLEYTDLIRTSGNRLMRLLDELVDFKRISSEEVDLSITKINAVDLCRDIVKEYQLFFQAKKQSLVFEADGNYLIETDSEKLRSIVENLLTNANKYTSQGGHIVLSVTHDAGGNEIAISISDNGQGFSRKDRDHLFQEFQTLSSRPTGGEGSTGLGLYIVNKLVQLLNGRIELDSEKGEGATFQIFLPLLKSD